MSAEVEIVGDSPEFFAPASTDMLDGLLAQHRAMRLKIEQVGAVLGSPDLGGALHYFAEHAEKLERNISSSTIVRMFDTEAAIAYLHAAYWSKAMQMTDVLDVMPQNRRNEWYDQMRNPLGVKKDRAPSEWLTPPIPEFNKSAVRSTFATLFAQRERFFAERVDGIFQSLSRSHVTNAPEGFGRRMILANAIGSFNTVEHRTAGVINDLRCIIARFMGRDEPKYDATAPIIDFAYRSRRGEWVSVDGGAIRIRCYGVGTAHLEVHPDMAWRLNCILAQLHPLAIPSEFRERPKKKTKAHQLIGRPLPFAVLRRLRTLDQARDRNPSKGWRDDTFVRVEGCFDLKGVYGEEKNSAVEAEVAMVLEGLGGAPVAGKPGRWAFDYYPLGVISEIVASGCLPDVKAHQFYPTPRVLAERLVEIADIGPEHSVLEPSAGQGGLADLLPKERTMCVEVATLNAKVLEVKGHRVVQADFLAWAETCLERFDRVVMNPPFSEGRAEAHTVAAAKLLAPGGRLVAILPSGMRGKDIPGVRCEWSQPMSNQFPGVSIDVVLLTATCEG